MACSQVGPTARHRRAARRGASAIEYALLVGMIALVCVVAFIALGGAVRDLYAGTAAQVAAALGG